VNPERKKLSFAGLTTHYPNVANLISDRYDENSNVTKFLDTKKPHHYNDEVLISFL
jgi:hypothetical protein